MVVVDGAPKTDEVSVSIVIAADDADGDDGVNCIAGASDDALAADCCSSAA